MGTDPGTDWDRVGDRVEQPPRGVVSSYVVNPDDERIRTRYIVGPVWAETRYIWGLWEAHLVDDPRGTRRGAGGTTLGPLVDIFLIAPGGNK